MDSVPAIASQRLQTNLAAIQHWFKNKGKIKGSGSRLVKVTFTTFKGSVHAPPVHNNNVQLSQKENVSKNLRLRLDRRLTWHKHIFAQRKQLGITLTKMYWLLSDISHNSPQETNFLYIKQYSNQSELGI
jgi:hypothetical protein